MAAITIRPMVAEDGPAIERQPSQRRICGIDLPAHMAIDEAQDLIDHGEAWTACREGVPVAMIGLREAFPGRQGMAWAVLGTNIGAAHLAITRHAAKRIALSKLVRIEAIVRADCDAEITWAALVGLKFVTLLRKFGAASEDHMMFERVR